MLIVYCIGREIDKLVASVTFWCLFLWSYDLKDSHNSLGSVHYLHWEGERGEENEEGRNIFWVQRRTEGLVIFVVKEGEVRNFGLVKNCDN